MPADFDLSGLDRLAADLVMSGVTVMPFAKKALEVTARNVKDEWNRNLYRQGHAKWTGYAVTYDINVKGGDVEAEIGAQSDPWKRQAGIVRYLEFGTPTSPPHGAGAGALQKNQDDFVHGIETAVGDALKAHDL